MFSQHFEEAHDLFSAERAILLKQRVNCMLLEARGMRILALPTHFMSSSGARLWKECSLPIMSISDANMLVKSSLYARKYGHDKHIGIGGCNESLAHGVRSYSSTWLTLHSYNLILATNLNRRRSTSLSMLSTLGLPFSCVLCSSACS